MIYLILLGTIVFVGLSIHKITSPILSAVIIFFSVILQSLTSNVYFMETIIWITRLSKESIIIIVNAFFTSNLLSLILFKLLSIRKYEKKLEYSDYFINTEIQKSLDSIYEEFQDYRALLGNNFFVSLFFVRGIIRKRICRIGFSGNIPKVASDWTGIINKPGKTTTGQAVISKEVSIFDFKKIDPELLNGLPYNIKSWALQDLSFRIVLPLDRIVNNILTRRTHKEVFIVFAINCRNKTIDWDDLANQQQNHLLRIITSLRKEGKRVEKFYDYYNT